MSVPNEQIFKEGLAQFVRGLSFNLTPALVQAGTAVLRTICNEQASANFSQKGPCLECSKETSYGPVLPLPHRQHGEEWLENIRKRWARKKTTYLSVSHEGLGTDRKPAFSTKLNGYAMSTVLPYFCPECHSAVLRKRDEQIRELRVRLEHPPASDSDKVIQFRRP